VGWQRVAPHLLKPGAPGERVAWYWDDGPLGGGGLLLWLDAADRVVGFELTHTPFPGTREYLADWRRGGALRLGQVGDGEGGPHHKMAPVVRYERPEAGRLAGLAAYFARNAGAVEARYREGVAAVLGASGADVALSGAGAGGAPGGSDAALGDVGAGLG
jgi:hypothetical protein